MKSFIQKSWPRLIKKARRGWTFIEVLIVIGIVIILSSFVGVMAFKSVDQARQSTAKSQIQAFSTAIKSFYLDCRSFPTEMEGLSALIVKPASAPEGWNGPYLDKAIPKDPWGHDYVYKVQENDPLNPFLITSLGSDGKEGGDGPAKDVSSDQ